MEYNAGIYLRLSHEDTEKSNSIENQRYIIEQYAKKNGFEIVKEYIDNGISGLLQNRPAFQLLLKDIENKNINMVIVKDYSRLTRDYLMAGWLTENFFPDKNIRFISIVDNIDTGNIYSTSDIMPFLAIANNKHCEDISKKVKAIKKNMKKEGKFVENYVSYGYKKDEEDKNKIVEDEKVSYIVKMIFSMYLNGKTQGQIARYLTSQGIDTAKKYKGRKVIINEWRADSIGRILKDPIYTGKMIINKYYTNYKIKKTYKTPKEKWKFAYNTHNALISEEDFEKVQELLESRKSVAKNDYNYLLKGLVYCKHCGARMQYKSIKRTKVHNKKIENGEETWYYKCRMVYRFPDICDKGQCIKESVLNEIVMKELKKVLVKLDTNKLGEKAVQYYNRRNKEIINIEKIKARKRKVEREISKLYDKRVKSNMNIETFKKQYEELNTKENKLKKQIEEIEKIQSQRLDIEEIQKLIQDFKELKEIDNDFIKKLVDKITVSEDKEVEISFKF